MDGCGGCGGGWGGFGVVSGGGGGGGVWRGGWVINVYDVMDYL